MKNQQLRSTALLYIFATIMIVNSHLESLYPAAWMAGDGLIGQCLFFFLSGFGVAKSLQKEKQSFVIFYGRRILRIYPTVIPLVFLLVYFPIKGWQSWGILNYFQRFLLPKEFGFIGFIMEFYVVLWVAYQFKNKSLSLGLGSLVCIITCVIIFFFDSIRDARSGVTLGLINPAYWHFFFCLMTFFGAWVGLTDKTCRVVTHQIFLLVCAVIIFLTYLGLKLFMFKGWPIPGLAIYPARIYIFNFVLMLPFTWILYSLLANRQLVERLNQNKVLTTICLTLSTATLEIYMTHGMLISFVNRFIFPINLLIYFPIILVVGVVTKFFIDRIRELFVFRKGAEVR